VTLVPTNAVNRERARRFLGSLALAAAVVGAAGGLAPRFVWNLSASLPRGLYRLEPAAPLRRGVIVSFPPPPAVSALMAARRYLPEHALLLKVVVGLPGDVVRVDDTAYVVNGDVIGRVARTDSAGRSLAPHSFSGVVPFGFAFVASRAPLSFDSRYLGPVPLSTLTVTVPVWTY
jgi:conjugative transfer signal peptidase TraF